MSVVEARGGVAIPDPPTALPDRPAAPAADEPSGPYLSVVAPVFNERQCLETLLGELTAHLDRLARSYEVLVVDDGSSDGTRQLLGRLRACFPPLRPFALDGHRGQSAALWTGISLARGQMIGLMDGDLQNDPADFAPLLARLEPPESWDCVVGVRRHRRDPWHRRLSSRIANQLAGRITGLPLQDAGCGLKVARARLLKKLPFFDGGHRFIATLVAIDGGRVLQLPVNHRPRPHGSSKYGHGLGRTLPALRDAIGVRWMARRKLRSHVQPIV
jgi:dolichol-phosphate mannosyltransferase